MIGKFAAISAFAWSVVMPAAVHRDQVPVPAGDLGATPQQAEPPAKTQQETPESAGSTQEDPSPPAPGTNEQVLEEILQRRPQRPLVPPDGAAAGLAGDAKRGATWPEGWQIVSRAGRVVSDGKDWVFVFESDHPDHPEPPIKLLPNLMLERMVRETRAAANAPVFIVSGEVTVFFSENYLLPRLALRKPESGNLSK